MRTVLFDYQAFAMQRVGGVSRYFAELIAHLRRRAVVLAQVPLVYSDNVYATDLLGIAPRPALYRYGKRGARLAHAWANGSNQRALRRALSVAQDPIVHPTYYHPYVTTLRGSHKLVVTVYDMTHERFPEVLPDPVTVRNKRTVMESADAIIAISESTKRDIAEFYPHLQEKTTVIHLAGSLTGPAKDGVSIDPSFERPYVLFVGSRSHYKNFTGCAHAVSSLVPQYPDLLLVCAGGGALTKEEHELLASLGIGDRTQQVEVDDTQLAGLYARAEAFVFPSRYEGFGLPVLEAMACGAPCLLSETSSLPEVGGDCALYFDPANVDGIAQVLDQVLGNDSLAQRLRESGFERARQFSWDACARKHEEVYSAL